jgi:hypothetical protein
MMWSQIHLESVSPLITAPLYLGVGLLTALVAVALVRLRNWQVGVWLVLGVNLLAGLPIAYAGTYLSEWPGYIRHNPNVLQVVDTFAFHLLLSAALVIGPLLVWVLWRLGEYSGRNGQFGYQLAFLGLLLILVGNLGDQWLLMGPGRAAYFKLGDLLFAGGTTLGVLIYILGSVLLGIAVLQNKVLPGRMALLLLIFPPLNILLILWGSQYIPSGLTFVIGLGWLLLGGWLATHKSVNNLSLDTAA